MHSISLQPRRFLSVIPMPPRTILPCSLRTASSLTLLPKRYLYPSIELWYKNHFQSNSIILGLAAQYQLGVNTARSDTKFMMNGVNNVRESWWVISRMLPYQEYFYAGLQQSVVEITDATDAIEEQIEPGNANVFDLEKYVRFWNSNKTCPFSSLTSFKADHMAEFTISKPFAVIFSGLA